MVNRTRYIKFDKMINSSVKADLDKFKKDTLRGVRLEVMKLIKDTEVQAIYDAPTFIKIDGIISDGGYAGEVGVMGRYRF